eukprot:CAMPEP_0115884740 /NCGR_PEP_ID=MMETSP0287-20121206/30286_1 /TAXON_ID=412157 /ORGANISM="Chrysochromulina rotalis, Strain UIO044" /LENGTH=69 /DNA_ID=CAMNT_0003341079 /DNA_START=25 /DNA_END=231 /DNA_ORIENTATION=+
MTEVRSAVTIMLRDPWHECNSSARTSSRCRRLATSTVSKPARAASRASSAPIPDDAPVTSAQGRSEGFE